MMSGVVGAALTPLGGGKPVGAGVSLAKHQTRCPVMGGAINKAHFADVKGKRIYVCCPSCIDTIKADPDTYIKKLESEGVEIEKTP